MGEAGGYLAADAALGHSCDMHRVWKPLLNAYGIRATDVSFLGTLRWIGRRCPASWLKSG